MTNLMLTLPAGAEWLIFLTFGLILPALAMFIVYNLAKKMMKESVKEALRELKEEGIL